MSIPSEISQNLSPDAPRLITKTTPRWLVYLWRTTLVVCVLLAAAATYLVPILTDKPQVTVDYLAQLNAPMLALPPEEYAWPIYRDAAVASRLYMDPQMDLSHPDSYQTIRPGEPRWADVATYLQKHSPLLDAIRKGSKLPILGLPLSYESPNEFHKIQEAPGSTIPMHEPSDDEGQTLHDPNQILLPHLALYRQFSKLLRSDALLAMEQHDTDRAMENFRAILNLSRQCKTEEFEISQLVAASCVHMVYEAASDLLTDYPSQFTDKQLDEFKQIMAMMTPIAVYVPDMQTKSAIASMQVLYGRSGKVSIYAPNLFNTYSGQSFWSTLPEAISMRHNTATHSEMLAATKDLQADANAYAAEPYWVQIRTESLAVQKVSRWSADPANEKRYWPVIMCFSSVDSISKACSAPSFLGDTLVVAIALEQFRRAQSRYPQTLSELVPTWLDELPIDYSTGLPLLYKLVNDKPLLYGRGLDDDDDGGTIAEPAEYNIGRVPTQGDWVLYPRFIKPLEKPQESMELGSEYLPGEEEE